MQPDGLLLKVDRVGKKSDETLSKIEEVQSVLRESIETAKTMTERSDKLILKYRQQIERERGES